MIAGKILLKVGLNLYSFSSSLYYFYLISISCIASSERMSHGFMRFLRIRFYSEDFEKSYLIFLGINITVFTTQFPIEEQQS